LPRHLPLHAETECWDDSALKLEGIDDRSHEARDPSSRGPLLNLILEAGLEVLCVLLRLPCPSRDHGHHAQREAEYQDKPAERIAEQSVERHPGPTGTLATRLA